MGLGSRHVSRTSLHAATPSLCGMFVQRELTSRVTRIDPGGSISRVDSFLKKSVVSLRYDGICTTRGRRWWSTYSEIRSVGALH